MGTPRRSRRALESLLVARIRLESRLRTGTGMAQSGEGWLDETRPAYLYRALAKVERGSPRSELFEELAREPEGQAATWAKKAGVAAAPPFRPQLRSPLESGTWDA